MSFDPRPWQGRTGRAAVRSAAARLDAYETLKAKSADASRARAMVARLWSLKTHDTLDIARMVGIPEHEVCRYIWRNQ